MQSCEDHKYAQAQCETSDLYHQQRLIEHATGTYSTQQKQNTSLMKRHLKVYSNGSTHGSQSLQTAFNGQITAELTTCTIFVDTLCKHYPEIVVLRSWGRRVGRLIILMEVAALN